MQRLQCDVLVIGAGLAGAWAAARAKEIANNVVLVEIARIGKSGKSAFSGAGILCPEDSDDRDAWQREIVQKGQFMNDQDWVSLMLADQPKRLRDMEQWGLVFERDEKGKVYRHVGLNHQNTRITTIDSLQMMEVMRRRLEAIGVTFLERVMVARLLTSDGATPTGGSVVGAIGFQTRTGETVVINASATVVASGGAGLFGAGAEGIAQAYWAGAGVSGMENCKCFDEMGFEDKYIGVHLNTYQRLGMRLFNASGERFMARYLPELVERGKREDLGLAIVAEGLQGRAPIYMDLRHLDKGTLDKLYTLPTTSQMVNAMKEEGIDFRERPVKYVVTSGPVQIRCGGIRVNIFGESSLPGLYAAGEASGYPGHGTYSVGGANLAFCCVGGYRAGEFAARFARENGSRPVNEAQVKYFAARIAQPLRARKGSKPGRLFDEVHSYLCPARRSIYRDAESINDVLSRIGEWRGRARALKADDPHELVRASKLEPYLQVAELIFRGSLAREETRANNIRIDFPFKDNARWLKWLVQTSSGKGRSSIREVPIPLYRYPVRPKEYTRIPVNLPYTRQQQ